MYSLMVFLKLSWWREFSKVCPSKSWEVASYGERASPEERGAVWYWGDTWRETQCYRECLGMLKHMKAHHRQKNFKLLWGFFFFFSFWAFSIWGIISYIAGIRVSTPPQKHHSTLFCQAPLLNLQTVQASLFRQSLSISVFFELLP